MFKLEKVRQKSKKEYNCGLLCSSVPSTELNTQWALQKNTCSKKENEKVEVNGSMLRLRIDLSIILA